MEISPNQFFIGLSGTNGRAQDRTTDGAATPLSPEAQTNAAKLAQRDVARGKADDVDVVALFNAQQVYANQTQNPKIRTFADIATNAQRSALFVDTYV